MTTIDLVVRETAAETGKVRSSVFPMMQGTHWEQREDFRRNYLSSAESTGAPVNFNRAPENVMYFSFVWPRYVVLLINFL